MSFASDGVNGTETLLLCGDGFDRPRLEVRRWVPPQPAREQWPEEAVQRTSLEGALQGRAVLPARPDGKPARLEVSHVSQYICAARLPAGGYNQVQAVYLDTADGSAPPRLVNRPRLWWAAPLRRPPARACGCSGETCTRGTPAARRPGFATPRASCGGWTSASASNSPSTTTT